MDMRIGAIAECGPSREIPNIVLTEECSHGAVASDVPCVNDRNSRRRSVRIHSEPLDGSTIGADGGLSQDGMIADCDVCRLGELKHESGFLTSGKNRGDEMADTAGEGVESQKRYTHSRSASDFGVQSATPGIGANAKKVMSRSLSSDPRLPLAAERE